MNNKNITWVLIALMCFSVLGLVYIQFYWINEAYHLKEADFRKQVNLAIKSVSNKLQQEEVVEAMMQQAKGASILGGNQTNISSDLQSGIEDYSWFRNQTTKLSDLEFGFSIEESNDGYFSLGDSIKDDASLKLKYTFEINEPHKNLKSLLKNSSKSQLELIENVIHQLNQKKDPKTRIKKSSFEALLNEELKNYNILMPHQYILSKEPDKVVIYQSDADLSVKKLYRSKYKIRLFPDDVINDEIRLYIHFPFQNRILLERLAHMLIGSFILILFIIGCFIYAVSVIKKQSMLSDMKTDFINNMTHELKTPIATISLASEMLSEKMVKQDESKIDRFVKVIFDENNRLKSQVEKVLQFAKIDKGEWNLQKTELNFHDILREVADSFTLQLKERNGSINLNLDAKCSMLEADMVHMKNIFSNLLDNAIKYCQVEPKIELTTQSNNKGITLFVKDNGIGMTKEETQRVFEKFYRASKGNVHDVKGFGLGLSYVYNMVTAHKGTIKVKSTKGKGSTFELFIPFESKNLNYEC